MEDRIKHAEAQPVLELVKEAISMESDWSTNPIMKQKRN